MAGTYNPRGSLISLSALDSLSKAIDHHSEAIRNLNKLHRRLAKRVDAIEKRPSAETSLAALRDRLGRQSVTENLDDLTDQAGQIGLSLAKVIGAERDGSQEAERQLQEVGLSLDGLRQRPRLGNERSNDAGDIVAGDHAVGDAVEIGAGNIRDRLQFGEMVPKVGDQVLGGGCGHDDSSTSSDEGTPLDHTVEAPGRPGDDSSPDAREGATAPWCAWCHTRRASRLVNTGPAWAVCAHCVERFELLMGTRVEYVVLHEDADPRVADLGIATIFGSADGAGASAHRGERIWKRLATAWREVSR